MSADRTSIGPAAQDRSVWPLLVGGSIVFGLAHTQAPLYYSNQHQYFLHGLAAAGAGLLERDWLANTLDPTPVFSAFVAFTYRNLDVFVFHLVFFLLQAIYFLSLLAIGSKIVPEGRSRRVTLIALGVMLIFIHSAAVRFVSVKLTGVDYPWYFQCGLAGQYVLGPGLQPSAFGVLLISSIAAFAHGRLALAVGCSCIACWIHATYLLPAAMLTATYMIVLAHERRWRTALMVGAAALVLVLPTALTAARTFGPSSPEEFAEAEKIVAYTRIPHHALIRRWLDRIAAAQIGWIGLAIIPARRTRLAPLIGIPAIVGALLTLLQAATENLSLALLFPWRISSVLMPIATAALCAVLASHLPARRWTAGLGILLVSIALGGGIFIQARGLAYPTNTSELQALEYIRDQKQPGDVYLIPVRTPGEGPRGSVSTSFTPPPRGQDKHLIVVDLQRFRLFTEAPLFIDYKAIPYKDREVLEWLRRVQACQKWYAEPLWTERERRNEMKREGITHILIQADRPIAGPGYELLYEDRFYRIYRIDHDKSRGEQ